MVVTRDMSGRIRLRAAREGGSIMISVVDSGIGIPADALGEVFAMFSQVKTGQDRSEGGLGIGLALSKGLVSLHGGTIEARSAGPGQGSEFIVHLPLKQVEASSKADSAPPPRSNTTKTVFFMWIFPPLGSWIASLPFGSFLRETGNPSRAGMNASRTNRHAESSENNYRQGRMPPPTMIGTTNK